MTHRTVCSKLLVGMCMVPGAAVSVSTALAQGQPADASQVTQLEEITVTARRQEESLQRIPVAVTALEGDLLDELKVQEIDKLSELAPNLVISRQPSSNTATSIQIRGIGQTDPGATTEQGVGLYLDGVYIARTAGAVFDLVDLERIEVLRGPQGTLFGRNTTGGAVQLVSRKPGDTFRVEEKVGFGRFGEWYSRTRVDTGLLGGSSFKATLAYLHRERDGYFDNTLAPDDKDPGSYENDAAWLALQGQIGERLSLLYTFDYNERDGTPVFFQVTDASEDARAYYGRSESFGGAPFIISTERRDSGQQAPFDGRFNSVSETVGHALTLEYSLSPSVTLKSITAYRSFEQDTICSLSGSGVLRGVVLDPVTFAPLGVQDLYGPYSCNNGPQRQHQHSQELQVLGSNEHWSYVGGLFYFFERTSEYNRQRLTFVLPGGAAALNLSPVQAFGGETRSKAVFGQVTYRPGGSDGRLALSGGVRYTRDDKTFYSLAFPETGDDDYSNVNWLVSADYRFTDDVMGYVRVSTGYKAGGFSPRSVRLVSFEPEEATAYEVGLKAEWLNRRVRTNVALFHTDYDDLQVQQFEAGTGGTTSNTVNAAKAQFTGFEIEALAVLGGGFMLDAAYGYVDAEYDEFLFRDPATDQIVDVADQGRFSNVAKNTLRVGLQYVSPPLRAGTFSARVDWFDRSERYFAPLDLVAPFNYMTRDPGTQNLSARVSLSNSWSSGSGTWEIGLWGDNLTNHDNVGYGIDFGSLGYGGRFYTEPRTYGVDVKVRF